ncbi:hypothetical protein JMUB7546_26520 [Staphylococcus aureus]
MKKGRGTTDMKGGLMALVVSLIELKEQFFQAEDGIRDER